MIPDEVGALLARGRSREAVDLARRGAAAHPSDARWRHLLGASLHASGASDAAVVELREAVRLAPQDATPWNTLGAVLVELGEIPEAEKALRTALGLHAEYAEARFNLALALKQRRDFPGAKTELERILARAPGFDAARFELATVLMANDEARAAVPLIDALMARFPQDPRLHAHRAAASARLGDEEAAKAACDRALALPNVSAREIGALAYTLASIDRIEEASAAARRAVALAPESEEVRALAGDALLLAGQSAEAMEHFAAIVARRPRKIPALKGLAIAARMSRDWPRAVQAYERQLEIAPADQAALHQLGIVLSEMGEHERSIEVLARALETGPRSADLLAALVQVKGMACDWSDLGALVSELREAALIPGRSPAQPQAAITLTEVTAREQRVWAENWAQAKFPDVAPMFGPAEPRGSRRIRVGYVSADFYDHATTLLLLGLLERHDRARFEIHAYSTGRDDGSPARHRVEAAVDHFVDLRSLPAHAAARRIARDGLDVLLDLGGYVKDSSIALAALRPARVQGHFLGYPGTTGAPFIDFFIADAFVAPPGSEANFSEKVLRMPACYQPNDPRRADPAPSTRAAFGIPERALVLCSFNQGGKIRPPVFARWCRLLEALPDAILWLASNGDSANARLRAAASQHRIDPSRLVFAPYVPQVEHIARLRVADIAIDTFPCVSHTTASDAVWAGVPLVTTYGETFASRVAASVLHAAGCGDWAFDDADRAFEATLALARDERLRMDARARLAAARSSPLFDANAFAAAFESLLERAAARADR